MFQDEFRSRYHGIPLAIYKNDLTNEKADHIVLTHRHKEMELIAMVHGQADFYINAAHYHLATGDTLLISPYALHRATVSAEANSVYDCLCFDLSLLPPPLGTPLREGLESGRTSITHPHISASASPAAQLFACATAAFFACEKQETGWEYEAIGHLTLLFAVLQHNSMFSTAAGGTQDADFCIRVINYIHAHYQEPITSATAAEQLYMNNSYFCRRFKAGFGTCFARYLAAYRIEKAKLLLSDTQVPITEVVEETGFQGFSYFDKVFRRLTGYTPSAYRHAATEARHR